MHSRIFCLVSKNETEEEKEKIRENFEFLNEDDLYEQFQCYGFDYCNEETNLRDDWEWLGQNKVCETYEENGRLYVRFLPDGIKDFVESKLEELKQRVEDLSIDNLDSFTVYDLKRLLNDEHSFWFLIDDRYNDYTFDSLMLLLLKNEEPKEYEVVKSVDYHF